MNADLLLEVIKVILGMGVGFFIHFLMLSPKIAELTSTIKHLSKTVDKLEHKVEDVGQLRRELTALEIRVSDTEAEIRVINRQVDFNTQSFKE